MTLKLRYLLAFYKSTLPTALGFALVLGLIAYSEKRLEEAIKVFLYVYPTWGLAFDALGKVCLRRNAFFFYHNAGWTTAALYATSFCMSGTLSLSTHLTLKWLWAYY